MAKIEKVISRLFLSLNPKQKEIISARFGLNGEPQTLEALGKKFGVTRERIRQIESIILRDLQKGFSKNRDFVSLGNRIGDCLRKAGGVLRKDKLISEVGGNNLKENYFSLFFAVSKAANFYKEDGAFRPFYFLDSHSFDTASDFIGEWAKILESEKEKILSKGIGYYNQLLQSFTKNKGVKLSHAQNYISISKKFETSPYGEVGLASWPEVNPKKVSDYIYLVLKNKKQPIHFMEIAKLVNQIAKNNKKTVVATVHNELIKDERFVLVGRGIYALKEDGYEAGTVKDIIKKILKREGPLSPYNIVLAVQKERFFKENTILANIRNKNLFTRKPDGTYEIRES